MAEKAIDNQPKRLTFLDLSTAVLEAWTRFGFTWQDMVEGFGGGSGLGMPPQDQFYDLARNAVDIGLKDQPEAELRRLMRSRLYQRHCNFEWHYDFTHGNEGFVDRYELLGVAVWSYLLQQMEWQHVEPEETCDDEYNRDEDDEDQRDDGHSPEQLALPL